MTHDTGTDPTEVIEVQGQSCTTLTPLIGQRVRALHSGETLEVRTDDPAARDGVPAWSRLTGNPIVSAVEEDSQRTTFVIQKK